MTVKLYSYQGSMPIPNSTRIDRENWTFVDSAKYDTVSGSVSVTRVRVDGMIQLTYEGSVVWERVVRPYESLTLTVDERGNATITDYVVK